MRPQWIALADIPYESMWADDAFWLPKVLAGKRVRGRFDFGPDNAMIAQHLEEV